MPDFRFVQSLESLLDFSLRSDKVRSVIRPNMSASPPPRRHSLHGRDVRIRLKGVGNFTVYSSGVIRVNKTP